MKKSTISNMFRVAEDEVLGLYADLIENSDDALLLAISQNGASDRARNALEKSLEALGYGAEACGYVRLRLEDDTTAGSEDLRTIVEGIDPLFLVCADEFSSELLAKAYRVEPRYEEASRIMGRDALMFHAIDSLLADDKGKQQLWALLKRFKR